MTIVKKFTKTNINNISLEDAHGGSGQRQSLVNPQNLISTHLVALTKGFLSSGNIYDWHTHENVDEIFIVLKGSGKFYSEEDVIDYSVDDVVTIPANLRHKIKSAEDSEFYFVRVKV
jgi:quercetin dioxygenase-like cupin family protein